MRARRSVALVGHEPNIGELAARLIGARSPIEFKKGAICRIDFDGLPPKSVGMLRWFLPPRILQARALTGQSRVPLHHPINSERTRRCAARAASVS